MKKISLNFDVDKLIRFSYIVIAVFAMAYFFGKDIAKKNRDSLPAIKYENQR